MVAFSTNLGPQTHDGAAYEPNGSYWPSVPEGSGLENYASESDLLAPDLWGLAGNAPNRSPTIRFAHMGLNTQGEHGRIP